MEPQSTRRPTSPRATPPADRPHHPVAALSPLMDVAGAEFGELVRDIQEHGLLQPIGR